MLLWGTGRAAFEAAGRAAFDTAVRGRNLSLLIIANGRHMLSPRHLEHLGGALKDLRGASGCTQAEVCARTGVKPPQLSRWENGRDVPTLESLIRYLGAVGAGLADLERVLLGDEEKHRRVAITQALREIHADHRRYLRSTFHVRLAFTRIARPNPDGLEQRWLHLLEEEAEPAARRLAPEAAASEDSSSDDSSSDGSSPAAVAGEAPDPDPERLVAGLPATLEELVGVPGYRSPPVVEGLIDRGWALLEQGDDRAVHVADAARLLAGELPAGIGRDRCFGLRARGLELWGMALRATGEPAAAEAALLAAFELLAQIRSEPADLAAILGRLALAASDRGHQEDVERYAGEAVRVVLASDRESPMPAFMHLWRAVMSDLRAHESVERVTRAVFQAMWQAWDGFQDRMWEMALEILEGKGEDADVERLVSDMTSWTGEDSEGARSGAKAERDDV